jgi:hypothetical protein
MKWLSCKIFIPENYLANTYCTLSLCTIDSLKVYAPVLGLRTVRINFVQFFASCAALLSLIFEFFDAAFAMIFYLLIFNSIDCHYS